MNEEEEFEFRLRLESEQAPRKAMPTNTAVAGNAINKGLADFPDMFLNAPTHAWNLGKAAVGTAATALGRPDLAPDLTPNLDLGRKAMEGMGFIHDDAEPQTGLQRVLASALRSGTMGMFNPAVGVKQAVSNMAISGAGGGAGAATKEATGSDTAAIVASMLTPMAVQGAKSRAQSQVAEAQIRQNANSVRDETASNARAAGYVLPPTELRPNALNNVLESIGGKAAIKQEASLRNQPVTNRLAAEELGLPKGTALTEGILKDFRKDAAQPYREIAAISPVAEKALERLKQARADATAQYKFYDRSLDPEALAKAKTLSARAETLETAIEKAATKAGRPELVNELREARQKIAKSYDIERALNAGDANINAATLGRAYDKGKPLTGNLETIAKFAEGPGTKFVREGSAVPAPGVSAMNAIVGSILGGGGAAAFGPAGLALAAAPFARGGVRDLVLSKPYQKMMGTPDYSPGMINRLMASVPANQRDAVIQALLAAQAENQ